MLIYLLTYLCIGALVMAIAILRGPYSNETDGMVRAVTGGDELYDKVLVLFIAPLVGCLFAVVAWPLVFVWMVQEMRRKKGKEATEANVQQPIDTRQEVHLFHPRINGKIVTKEEMETERLRASGLPDSVAKAIADAVIQKAKEKSMNTRANE